MMVERTSQQSPRVHVPRVSHRVKAVPSLVRGCPRGQTSARLPRQCSDATANANICCGLVAVRPPAGVGETGFSAVEGRWRPPPAPGWHGGMGIPHTPCGLSTDDVGEWERQPKLGSHQRAMRKRTLHCLCYTSRGIRGWRCSCFVVSPWHARRRREASPWMSCCRPGDEMRMGNGWE
jgi:hypothetical protein